MAVSLLISITTASVTGVFALMVLARYRVTGRWHLFAWGVGLLLYSLGTTAQAVLFTRFNAFPFKMWYWAGALVVAPWLGQGTAFLLARKRIGTWISFWLVVAFSLVGLLLIFTAGVDPDAYQPGVDMTGQYKEIFTATGGARAARTVLAISMNTYGTALLVGGALYSAYLSWHQRAPSNRTWGNVLIAVGGLLPAMGGTLILLGSPDFKYAGQLLGGILLFAGFLVATRDMPK